MQSKSQSTTKKANAFLHAAWVKSNFRVETAQELGSGSFGVVFAIRNRKTDEEVAVKMNTTPEANLKSLLNEVSILVSLSGHPNIVTVKNTSFDSNEGIVFIEMEKASGNLGDFIKEELVKARTASQD